MVTTIIQGTTGNDSLVGTSGADIIHGLAGDDTYLGGGGDDEFVEPGVDSGNDTYVFGLNAGKDVIYESGVPRAGPSTGAGDPMDVIVMDPSISKADVRFSVNVGGWAGTNLVITSVNNTSELTVANFFEVVYDALTGKYNRKSQIEEIRFADGAVETTASLWAQVDALGPQPVGDFLLGTQADDLIDGLGGNDLLFGDEGNDTLIGGAGDDVLNGSAGNDVYVWAGPVERSDTIQSLTAFDTAGFDTVQLGATITTSNITLYRDAATGLLSISYRGSSSDISGLLNEVDDGSSAIDAIRFSNGLTWGVDEIKRQLIKSTDGNDYIVGFSSADVLSGGTGHDTIFGHAGNDTLLGGLGQDVLDGGSEGNWLDGGEGNDTLRGGEGNDTLIGGAGKDILSGGGGSNVFVYSLGDGADSVLPGGSVGDDFIRMGPGIRPADVRLSNLDNNLLLRVNNSLTDTLLYKGTFSTSGAYAYDGALSSIEFDDGTVWAGADIDRLATQPTGTEFAELLYASTEDGEQLVQGLGGNDTLRGSAALASETLVGGAGNDHLLGAAQRTVYQYQRGDGIDFLGVTGGDGVRVLQLGDLISATDVSMTRGMYNELGVLINGGAGGRIHVDRQFLLNDSSWAGNELDEIRFADGTAWDATEIRRRTSVMTYSGSSTTYFVDYAVPRQTGSAGADVMIGATGNEWMDGAAGHDDIRGAKGIDTLWGGEGNDVLSLQYGQADGGAGNDTISITGQADSLSTPAQKATVRHGRGAGNDTVVFVPSNPAATMVMSGVNTGDVMVTRDAANPAAASIVIRDTGETLTLSNLASRTNLTDSALSFEFADGVLNAQQLLSLRYAGTDGNDSFSGWASENERMSGGAGHDTLGARAGDDTLEGGVGNDDLSGGAGNDVYIFSRGDGADTISESSDPYASYRRTGQMDTILLGAGILAQDVGLSFVGDSNDLLLTLQGTTDSILMKDFYDPLLGSSSVQSGVDEIRFADGSSWNAFNMLQMATPLRPNHAQGQYVPAIQYGGHISGAEPGVDVLVGSFGDDFYIVSSTPDSNGLGAPKADVVIEGSSPFLGSGSDGGNDTVSTDISGYTLPDNVENLVMTGKGESMLGKAGRMSGTGNASNNRMTGRAYDDLMSGLEGFDTLEGGAGNDTLMGGQGMDQLWGGDGNDLLMGGDGYDILRGGAGNDTYEWGAGLGGDIYETTGDDVVKVLPGVAADQLWFENVYGDLQISILTTPSASNPYGSLGYLTLKNWFAAPQDSVERIELANGQTLQIAQAQSLVDAMAAVTRPSATAVPQTPEYAQVSAVIASTWV